MSSTFVVSFAVTSIITGDTDTVRTCVSLGHGTCITVPRYWASPTDFVYARKARARRVPPENGDSPPRVADGWRWWAVGSATEGEEREREQERRRTRERDPRLVDSGREDGYRPRGRKRDEKRCVRRNRLHLRDANDFGAGK